MRRSGVLAILATAVLAGSLAAAPPVSAEAAPAVDAPTSRAPRICQNEINASQRFGVDTSQLDLQGLIRLDGLEVVVRGPDADWSASSSPSTTWLNRFHSLAWMVMPALRGEPMVDLLVERELVLPDPGHEVDKARLRAEGWTEGAVRLRQGAVNCLYAITGDPRLIPVVEGLVKANLDPMRYRGRPHSKPHNHGVLANHALLESSRLFGRPGWAEQAFARFGADARSVFSFCGMTAEQSSTYHLLNVSAWQRAIREIEAAANPLARSVAERIHVAELAAVRLARPDGILEAIGNGNPADISRLAAEVDLDGVDPRLWCGSRGWSANRTAWVDPLVQYTLRSGTSTRMHGHEDHGSLTWWARGVPVLSDRGLFDKARTPRFEWARGMSAHSVFEPVGRPLKADSKARTEHGVGVDRYRITTIGQGLRRERLVTIPLADSSVVVRDSGTSRREQQWMQHWQLNEDWQAVSGTTPWTPIARHASGLSLYAVCFAGSYGRPAVSTVETFPDWRTAVSAHALACGTAGREVKMSTLLVVSDIDGTLTWDHRGDTYEVIDPNAPPPDPVDPPTEGDPGA